MLRKAADFLERQVSIQATGAQRIFDALLGVVAPAACVALEMGLFNRDKAVESSLFSGWEVYLHSEVGLGLLLLTIFLSTQHASPLLAGGLFGGSAFSFLVGIYLLPLTVVGLAVGLQQGSAQIQLTAALGAIPVLTGFVFLRNACRCYSASLRTCSDMSSRLSINLTVASTAGLVLIIPAVPDLVVYMLVEPTFPGL